jgi:ribosomal-protein-alanine N-acetyltransferase
MKAPHREPYFLTTARLGFRCWSRADLSLATSLWGDPAVTQYLGGPFTTEKIKERLESEIQLMRDEKVQYWPLFLLQSGDNVGCGGLRPYRAREATYELGIHLRPMFWGRGLAEESLRAIIAFAFETLGARALFAGHHPANTRSRSLIERLGFRFWRDEMYPPTGLKHASYLLMAHGGSLPQLGCD